MIKLPQAATLKCGEGKNMALVRTVLSLVQVVLVNLVMLVLLSQLMDEETKTQKKVKYWDSKPWPQDTLYLCASL